MCSKNNILLKKEKCTERVQKYSIKKLSVGVASVLVGTALFFGTASFAEAAELSSTEESNNTSNLVSLDSTENVTTTNEAPVEPKVTTEETKPTVSIATENTTTTSEAPVEPKVTTEETKPTVSIATENTTTTNEAPVEPKVTTEETKPIVSIATENATTINETPIEPKATTEDDKSTISESVSSTSNETKTEDKKEDVNAPLNRVANGDFEDKVISNKTKWTVKPWGVSEIVNEGNNKFGKISGETKDEYILQKIPTTPGKTYTVTADLKVVARNATPTGAYFTAKEFTPNKQQGKVYNQIYLNKPLKDWTKQTFEFTAEGAETLVGIVKWNPTDKTINTEKTEISIDNLVVVEKPDSKYETVWEEDFKNSDLDKDTWSYMPGTVGRSEQQNYTTSKDNVAVEDGKLVLKVTKREKEEPNPRKPKGRTIKYDSGFINTSGKKDFLYGRIEMKAKLPKGKGAFPAFWLMGTSYGWPGGGEIDIMELIGSPTVERAANGEADPTDNERQSNKIVYGTPHFYYVNGDVDKDGSYDPYELGGNVKISDDFYEKYHIFGIDWSPERIDWYLDGVIYNSMNLVGDKRLEAAAKSINRPQILKLNLATGGDWAGDAGAYLADDKTSMVVDWIRWSQNEEQKKAAEDWYANAPKLKGVSDVVIKEGTNYDLLSSVTVDRSDYVVNASIDDEYMYTDTGEMKLVNVINKNDISKLKTGIYNIHYSAVPKNKKLTGDSLASGDIYKTLLKTVTLVVLPKSGLSGQKGNKLDSIKLPKGWVWDNDQLLIGEKEFYKVKFSTNENSRAIFVDVPVIAVDKSDQDVVGALNKVLNGSFENNYISAKRDWEFKSGSNSMVKIDPKNGNSVGVIRNNSTDEFILQKVPTTPGKSYVLEADVLADSTTNLDGIYLTVKSVENGKQGKVIKQLKASDFIKGKKEKHTIEFIANSDETYIGIVKWAENINSDVKNSSIQLDNVSVKEKEAYKLVWEDNFVSEELNQDVWGYELGNIRGNEQEHYSSSKDNVAIENGNLVLKVTNRPKEDQYRNTDRWKDNARLVKYNSGSVRTQGKQEFLYGRIEAKAKLPKGKGVFPAFWTLGADFHMDGRINPKQGYDWPTTGEIDIMELIGAPTDARLAEGERGGASNSNKNAVGTPHFYFANTKDGDRDGSYGYYDENGKYVAASLGGNLEITEDFYDKYHIFGINWTPDKIEWYVDDVVYNTLNFADPTNPANDKRLKAAAASLNRPQYIQFNLATGGNWAGDAGDYLAEDGTEFKIDWVRWLQTDDQKAAMEKYYKDAPKLKGVENITMLAGSDVDLLANVSTDKAGYKVDFSIDNEFMFENTGASNGRNEVKTQVKDSKDIDSLRNLAPGVYNLHYTALPDGKNLNGWVTPNDKLARKTVLLTILPKEGLSGVNGEKLSTVALPYGWDWKNKDLTLGLNDSYDVVFRQKVNSGVSDEKERKIFVSIPARFFTLHEQSKGNQTIDKDNEVVDKNELDNSSDFSGDSNFTNKENKVNSINHVSAFKESSNSALVSSNFKSQQNTKNEMMLLDDLSKPKTESIYQSEKLDVLPKTGEENASVLTITGGMIVLGMLSLVGCNKERRRKE